MMSRDVKYHEVAEESRKRARMYLRKGNVARAFSHFLVAIKLEAENFDDVAQEFIFSLRELGLTLEAKEKYNELFACYEQALEVTSNCCEIHNNFGAHLFRLGQIEEATVYFLKALKINPDFLAAKENLDNVSNALIERWHFPMLNDTGRNFSYRSAIRRAVEKGHKSVIDIGSGTGILSLFAVEAGATYAAACEMSKVMFSVCKNVFEVNNFGDKIKLFNMHSSVLSVPQHIPTRIQLVITETLDCGLLGENILSTLKHAWDCLLVPAINPSPTDDLNYIPGRVIPKGATVVACLVECGAIRKQSRVILSNIGPLDLQLLQYILITDEDPYLSERLDNIPGGIEHLSEPFSVMNINFNSLQEINNCIQGFTKTVQIKTCASGNVDAVVMWFELHLDEEESISTSKDTCWEQAIFPLQPGTKTQINKNCTADIEIKVSEKCLQLNYLPPKPVGESSLTVKRHSLSDSEVDFFKYSRSDLVKINDHVFWFSLFECLQLQIISNYRVLDNCRIPFGALLSMKLGAKHVAITENCNASASLELACFNGIDLSHVQVLTKSELVAPAQNRWDLMLVDIVEANGLLKQGVFEEIAVLRHLHLKPSGLIIPQLVIVNASVIESEALMKMNRLIDDHRVGGFTISSMINVFKVSLHCDINMSTVMHRKLTDTVEILQIPVTGALTDISKRKNSIETEAISDGLAQGIFIWYSLLLNKTILVDTSDPSSQWKQCCKIFDKSLCVKKGQKLVIDIEFIGSCFDVNIKFK